ncbi:OPT oligopeptide transporter protein-domain-containing protein [Russula brevipes]|nr:OPT oligopeptide transporter protein-domain-containing protein [Russula brevipes]
MSTSREHADVEKRIPEHGGAAADRNMQAIDIDDPNFDPTLSMVQEESPYAEVRSAVANTDDPTMPASTLRAWVVGLVWAVLIPGANHFYSFRYPSAFVSEHIPMLLILPICRAWARYVPNRSIFGLPLNPGPFNTKEHVIISVMADVAAESAYGTYVVAVQRVFYDQHPTFAYQYIIGALAPLFQWIIHKKFNRRSLKYLHFPVIFSSTSFMPPATPINYVPFVLGCYLLTTASVGATSTGGRSTTISCPLV